MPERMSKPEFKEKGDSWKNEVRNWLKLMCNGQTIDWSSDTSNIVIIRKFTVRNLEDFAGAITRCVLGFKPKGGGEWLGCVREWMKWNCVNGDCVTWGSNEVLVRQFSVNDFEDMAGEIAYAAYEEYVVKESIDEAIDKAITSLEAK